MLKKSFQDLEKLYNSSPLFTVKSEYESCSHGYFAKHTHACINDCFPSKLDSTVLPLSLIGKQVLMGCVLGFLIEHIGTSFPITIDCTFFKLF